MVLTSSKVNNKHLIMPNENDEVIIDSTETNETETVEETTESEVTETPVVEKPQETLEQREARLERQLAQTRKKLGKPDSKPAPKIHQETQSDLSSRDTIALINAKVTEPEDIDEVMEWARFKKIPVSEALKSETIKARLNEKTEQRKVALATNTGASRRTTTKITPDVIVEKASRGELPDSEEGMAQLAQARLNQRKARK